ncbi:MAG: TolC family protein, partial [Desulfobacteraceae bacterium]|nr:TolC family protein [Desulfobacteraceae bacterium]
DLRVSQTLFQGLMIFNTYQKAIIAADLARAQKNQTEMDLILDIQTNFLKLLKASEDVRSLQSAVERLEINEKSVKAYYENQMTPYLSVLQSKVDLADAQEQLSQAKNLVETQKVTMNLLLGIPVETPVVYEGEPSLEASDVDIDLARCLDCAYQNRPEVEVAQKSIEMAEKELAIQRGRFSPKVSANYDYIIRNTDYKHPGYDGTGQPYNRDEENTYWMVALQLQWDFNLGGQQFYQQARAKHDMERLIHHRQEVKDQISAQIRTSFLKLQEAKSRIATSRTALDAAEESYARSKKWSQVQMGTIIDLLDIQAKLTRAEANRNIAMSDYRLSLANLYYAMGRRNDGLTEPPTGLVKPAAPSGDSN